MHLKFSVQNSIVIYATWSVMDKELRIVVASPWFATKKEVGGGKCYYVPGILSVNLFHLYNVNILLMWNWRPRKLKLLASRSQS